MKIGSKDLKLGKRTYVMGILNVTPDPFLMVESNMLEDALEHAMRMVEEGADIIDVCGESTTNYTTY